MNEKKTAELDQILKNTNWKTYEEYRKKELSETLPNLADYLNEYLATNNLNLPDVIKSSLLSKDYAYNLFNGNRTNPTRDRVIALCLAMHMSLEEVKRTLKLCHLNELYSKDSRDALLMIAFNTQDYDVMKINDILIENGFEILQTSKDIK